MAEACARLEHRPADLYDWQTRRHDPIGVELEMNVGRNAIEPQLAVA
jgi:hypothetical protein